MLGPHHDVVFFEADTCLGGHVNTVDVIDPAAGLLRVDTGFIVHKSATTRTSCGCSRSWRHDGRHRDELCGHRPAATESTTRNLARAAHGADGVIGCHPYCANSPNDGAAGSVDVAAASSVVDVAGVVGGGSVGSA